MYSSGVTAKPSTSAAAAVPAASATADHAALHEAADEEDPAPNGIDIR
jgi:hypothetical protein